MRRPFAVTDLAILDGFSFEQAMSALVEQSGVRGMTATQLYQQCGWTHRIGSPVS